MIVFPHAKINVGLHVTGRRPDGYHSVETVLLPVRLCDALEATAHPVPTTFSMSGIPIPDDGRPNLCMQAVQLFRERLAQTATVPHLQVHLHKYIPVGAGLGGGSSDAAFMLRLLNALNGVALDPGSLRDLAASLGSDCPFFLSDGPALASGRGEILHPIELPMLNGFVVILAVPPIHVSTAEAYAGIVPKAPAADLREILSHPTETWKEKLVNDFEGSIFAKHPQIRAIKERMYTLGASYAAMSGSGSAVYGLFREDRAAGLDGKLQMTFPGCFTWKGPVQV